MREEINPNSFAQKAGAVVPAKITNALQNKR